MTYTAGSIIQATDYNGFVSTTAGANVNATWSTGTSSAGYGQGALSTVSPSAIITATQWAGLVNTIASMANHQGTTITSRTAPVVGDKINILSSLNTDLTNCYTNRANAYASGAQYTGWTGTNSVTGGKTAGAWTMTFTNTVTFASADAARYFFNAGGLIKLQTSKTSTGATGDPEWNDLANNLIGSVYISGISASHTIAGTAYTGTTKVGGSGTPAFPGFNTNCGYFGLTPQDNVYAIFYEQAADSAPYTSNYIQYKINLNAAATTLTIITTWNNPEGDPITGGTAAVGATPGTAPCTICTYFPPETTYLTNSWGTPTIVSSVS